ncbi:hypothetical protein ACSBR2_033206 [Camellia fascicularis]
MQFGKAYRTIKCCSLSYACVVSKAYRTIKVLKPNDYLLFCDYATCDLAQVNLQLIFYLLNTCLCVYIYISMCSFISVENELFHWRMRSFNSMENYTVNIPVV